MFTGSFAAMYQSVEAAQQALTTAKHDVAADFGLEAVDDAHSDLVRSTNERPLHGETAMRAEELLMECPPWMTRRDKTEMLVSYLGVSEEQARRFVEGRV